MLYAKVNLAVRQNQTFSNRKIMLYRGDSNVDIEFTLTSSDYVLSECKYIQAVLTRPYAPSIFSEIFEIQENVFILTITEDMIDELTELETYSMQLIMYDETQEDKITLPPCYDIFDVKKPLATEAARINWAAINYDAVAIDDNETGVGDIFDGNEYNPTNWRDGDVISDIRMNKIEEALVVISHKSGSGGGVSSVYISSDSPEVLVLNAGGDLEFDLNFISPNPGKGTLNVSVNNVSVYTASIAQGGTIVRIPERVFSKGINTMTLYALDRAGGLSNTIMFEVRYGSLEVKSDFDSQTAYDVQTPVRYYFTPTSADTSLALTFYMTIDGETQDGVSCTSDVRSYYTFPTDLTAGCYRCEAFISDPNGNISNVLKFNLVLLDNTSIVVSSETKDVVIEEGLQLSLDFKVYMKNNISFITKVYVDNNLVNTGTCGLEKSYYKTSSLTEGEHVVRLEVYNEQQTVSDSITWGVTVTESLYQMIEASTAGLLFSATAYNKTNSDQGKEKWVGVDQDGRNIVANLINFSFNNESGWVDDALVISGNSHVVIPVAPLAGNAAQGLTLDIEFLSKQIGVENAEVLTVWDNTKDCGIKITTENMILRSAEGHECNLYFTDNEFTNVIFVIDRNEKKAKVYLNGVMCEAFHLSDYTANGVFYPEDFSVSSNVILGGANTNGYSQIRNIRIYEVALTTNEILNNFISNTRDKAQQQALVEFQKGNDLPTLTVYCDFSGLGKDDKKPCKIVYNSTDELKYGKSFILDHKESQLQYQGTSSMAYPIKNYRLNLRDENGEKWYYDFPGGKPECRFTLKADFMSSGHWQNTGFTKWVNDNLYNYDPRNEKSMNPKKWFDINNGGSLDDTRECIYGFPCRLILVNDGKSALNEGQNEPTPGNTKDMGIFNFNHDKDCAATIGLDQENFPNCASFEIAANSDTSAGAFMSYDNVKPENTTELEYLKQSFELRFPSEEDVPEGWGFLGTGEEGTGIKALIDWVDNCTDEEFVRDFEQHFHKDYTLRYYLMVMTCGMVDNLGKNLMLDTWDNKIFMPRFYDCDTICSYDNSGDIKFDVDIEMEQGYWNTSSSRLWTRIRDLMHNDLVEKYNDMRQNGLSYESLMSYFYDEQIAKIPQKYYNMDYDVKYAPFADSYIGMAHGDGYQHLKRWLKNRLTFCDTLFDYAPSYNNDVLTIRANTTELMTIYIETYTPVYQHVSWYNGQMDKKKIDGKIAISFSGTAMAATDQEVLIYGGTNVKKITGIESMNPNQMLIGYATRLTEIDASDCALLADINSDGANLSPHIYLNNVDLSNCPALSGNLRLNNSQLLQNVDISGTAISGLQLPTSLRSLETLKLSEDIANLTLRDASLLQEIQIPTNIEYLSLINVPNLKRVTSSVSTLNKLNTLIMENPTINPVSDIASKAPNLRYARLTGLNIRSTAAQVQTIANLKGLDAFGNEIPISQAVTGKITLAECSPELEQELKGLFPLVTFIVDSYVESYTVTFVDGNGKTLYTTRVVKNGEAVYVGPTPTKTSTAQYDYTFKGWDRQLKPIIGDCVCTATFNSILRYYVIKFVNGITHAVVQEEVLAYGTKISKPDIPEGANIWLPTDGTVTGPIVFTSQYLPYPEDTSIFNFTGVSVNGETKYEVSIKNQAGLPSFIILPFKHPDNGREVYSFQGTNNKTSANFSGITELYIPETITRVGWYAFQYLGLTEIHLPKSVKSISTPNKLFGNCPNLTTITAPGITSVPAPQASAAGMFYYSSKLTKVTFGSEEYPFTSWNEYDSSSTSNHHAYSNGTFDYINLVTKNGLQTDVKFSRTFSEIRNYEKFIFTTTPVEDFTEGGYECRNINNHVMIKAYKGTDTTIEIPTTLRGLPVTELGYRAFYPNTTNAQIEKITGTSITKIGAGLFDGSKTLTNIEFPNVKEIGDYAFRNCDKLTAVDLPNATSLGIECFYDCDSMTSLNIPKVTSISQSGLKSCDKLVSVNCPSITIMGSEVFMGDTKIESISLPLLTVVPNGCFRECYGLKTVYMPQVTTVNDYGFMRCYDLITIDFPLLTVLKTYGFYECSSATTINLPKLTAIQSHALAYCDSVETLDLPTITSIGPNGLKACTKLNTINIPLVLTVNDGSFNGCSALETLHLPSVVTLDNGSYGTFSGCTYLRTLTLGGVGKPVTDTSKFNTGVLIPGITSLIIYVEDAGNPPALTGSPWGATGATIEYRQA